MVGIKAHKSTITTDPLPTEQKIANLVNRIDGLEGLCTRQTIKIQMLESALASRDETIDRYYKMIEKHCVDLIK